MLHFQNSDIGSLTDPSSIRLWKKYEGFINSQIEESYDFLLEEFQEDCQREEIEVESPLAKIKYREFLAKVQGESKTCPYTEFDHRFKEFKKRYVLEEEGLVEKLKSFTCLIEGLPEICLYAAVKNERAKTAYDASKNESPNLKGKERQQFPFKKNSSKMRVV